MYCLKTFDAMRLRVLATVSQPYETDCVINTVMLSSVNTTVTTWVTSEVIMGHNIYEVNIPKLLNDINKCYFDMVRNSREYIRRENFLLQIPTRILFDVMHYLDRTNAVTIMLGLTMKPQTLFGFQLVEDNEGLEVRLTATKGDLVLGSERIDV